MNLATSILQRRDKRFFWIALLAVVFFIYIPIFHAMLAVNHGSPVLGSDSNEYAVLIDNLVHHGSFSISTSAPFVPDTFRTIGYPAFVAFFLLLGLPLVAIPIIQLAVALLTVWGMYLVGDRFFTPRVGMYAGILYLIDPVTIMNTLTITTDGLFVCLLVFSIYFFSTSRLPLSGFVLGLSTLVRPVSMFLLGVYVLVWIIKEWPNKKSWKVVVVPLVLCIICCAIAVVPWMIRNHSVSNVFGLSTVKAYNLYHYNVPEFLATKQGISAEEARKIVAKDMGTFDERSLANASKMQKRAFEFIKSDLIGYAKFHIIKTIPFFLSSGIETSFSYYNDAAGKEVFGTVKENMTSLLLRGNIGEMFKAIAKNPAIAFEQIVLVLFWILALVALCKGYKTQSLRKIIFLWLIIGYFAALTGPVAFSRYRLPATPFLFLLVTYAIVIRLPKPYETPHNYPEAR